MIEVAGLHTHFGNLHVPHENHPALVSDLIEEFRAMVVDSLVSNIVNTRMLKPEDFTPPDARGGVYLHPDGLKRFYGCRASKTGNDSKSQSTNSPKGD